MPTAHCVVMNLDCVRVLFICVPVMNASKTEAFIKCTQLLNRIALQHPLNNNKTFLLIKHF